MLSKPISEVAAEFNPDDRCTPSYVRVPAAYPKLKSSGRTELGGQVLNDAWVSIISGSEDYSFKVCACVASVCVCVYQRATCCRGAVTITGCCCAAPSSGGI